MAKTKKEKIVDLKPKAEKITEQELGQLQAAIKTIIDEVVAANTSLGNPVSIQKGV